MAYSLEQIANEEEKVGRVAGRVSAGCKNVKRKNANLREANS